MITDEQYTKISYAMASQFEQINTDAITKMSEHIRDIGRLDKLDLHRLEQMNRMNANIAEINKELQKQCQMTSKQLNELYLASGLDTYQGTAVYYAAKGVKQQAFQMNNRVQAYIQSVSERTAKSFENLSRTTALSENYRKLVDRGIYAVSTGMEDYKSAIRHTLTETVDKSMRVTYASTYIGKDGKLHHRTRRMDSAARMNILEGVRQVQFGVRDIAGEEFGADGYEITAHALSRSSSLL